MNGMPRRAVISFSCPALSSANCSDSITHGPAIRKNGRSSPTSKPQSFIVRSRHPASRDTRTSCSLNGDLRFLYLRPFASRPRREDVAAEQRVTVARARGKLRMELHADEPWMGREFDDLDQAAG